MPEFRRSTTPACGCGSATRSTASGWKRRSIAHPPLASSGRKGLLRRTGYMRPRYICTPIASMPKTPRRRHSLADRFCEDIKELTAERQTRDTCRCYLAAFSISKPETGIPASVGKSLSELWCRDGATKFFLLPPQFGDYAAQWIKVHSVARHSSAGQRRGPDLGVIRVTGRSS